MARFYSASRTAVVLLLIGLGIVAAAGCQSAPPTPRQYILDGQFGHARVLLAKDLPSDRSDRRYLLDRMAVAILTLADGYPSAAHPLFEQIYEVLRTQGINRNKTVEAVVLNEDLKFWKGEPFEQALAMLYYSLQQGELGLWDNARAAAGGSLFRLKDFGDNEKGDRINTLEIARRAMRYEKAMADNGGGGGAAEPSQTPDDAEPGDYLNSGYAVRESNFALGYLISAVANLQMQRHDEAADHLAVAVDIDPALQPVCDRLREGGYNAVLVVGFGLGPRKIGYGPDRAMAGFRARFDSDDKPLMVRVGGGQAQPFAIACDVNAMAADHMWNNLEDVRLAKSTLGSALLVGGAIAADIGQKRRSKDATYAGLGAMAVGMIMKAGAHADTRHCEVLPQRYYLVPIDLPRGGADIEMQVQDEPQSRLILTGMRPGGPGGPALLRYVRLVSDYSPEPGTEPAPRWAVSGRIVYSNDQTGAVPGPQRPYILGGHCVRRPADPALADYRASGYLNDLTTYDLAELYRREQIMPDPLPKRQLRMMHLLEGGRSMATPLVGTTGFVRLFGQEHPSYSARSPSVHDLSTADNRPLIGVDKANSDGASGKK